MAHKPQSWEVEGIEEYPKINIDEVLEMKKNIEFGAFCEVYGKTLRNCFLEHLLAMRDLDFAVGDMAKEINISRPKAYEIIKELEKEGIIKKTRVVGKTQLYILNKEDKKVKLLLKDFKECLNLVIEEYAETASETRKPKSKKEEVLSAHIFIDDTSVDQRMSELG